jgi:hypothetical protein
MTNAESVKRSFRAAAVGTTVLGLLLTVPGALRAAPSDSLTLRFQLLDQFPPKAVTDLAGSSPAEQQINLTWTAPDEDDLPNPSNQSVAEYFLKMDTFTVVDGDTTTWWNRADDAPLVEPFPNPPGTAQFMILSLLEPGVTYYFGLRSRDEVPNYSAIDDLSLSSSTQLKVIVRDDPPSPPANLTATPGNGQVYLDWDAVTAPDLDVYRIYVDSVTPYDFATPTLLTVSASTTSYLHAGLTNGVTYYYYVTAVDRGAPFSYALESSSSNIVSAKATTSLPPDAPTLTVDLTQLTTAQVRWILRDNALEEDELYISQSTTVAGRFTPNFGPLTLTGSTVTFTETGLTPNTLIARYGEASNVHGSSWSAPATVYTLANPPINTTVVGVTSTTITVAWNANGNADPTFYEVEYDKDSSFNDAKSAGGTLSTTFTIFDLESQKMYSVRVRARNGDGIYTVYDVPVSTKTTRPKDTVPPKAPHPLKVDWDKQSESNAPGAATLRIEWRDVSKNVDGTPFDDPAPQQYRVYRSKSFRLDASNPAEKVWSMGATSAQAAGGTISGTLDVLGSSDLYYYRVRAVDEWGNESPDSMIIEAKGDGSVLNILAEGEDKISQLSLPAAVARSLMQENNSYGDDLLVKVSPMPDEEKNRVVRSVQVAFHRVDTGDKIDGYLLSQAGVVKVGFQVQNGFVTQGAPVPGLAYAPTNAPVIEEKKAKDSLSLFWHNGVEWVKVGGIVDPSAQRVELKTRRVGRYQVRQAIHLGPVSLTKVYPRVITPNDDGWNDKVIFEFDNPGLVSLKGEIFDVTGAKVSDMVPGPSPDTTLMWDGKRGGSSVPSGIYIYQIEAGGEVASGTVVVAQ